MVGVFLKVEVLGTQSLPQCKFTGFCGWFCILGDTSTYSSQEDICGCLCWAPSHWREKISAKWDEGHTRTSTAWKKREREQMGLNLREEGPKVRGLGGHACCGTLESCCAVTSKAHVLESLVSSWWTVEGWLDPEGTDWSLRRCGLVG